MVLKRKSRVEGDWLLVIVVGVSRLMMILFNEGRKHSLICASPSSETVYAKPQDVTWEKVSQKKTSLPDGLWLPIKFSSERQRPCESPKLLDNCIPRAFCVSGRQETGNEGQRHSCHHAEVMVFLYSLHERVSALWTLMSFY